MFTIINAEEARTLASVENRVENLLTRCDAKIKAVGPRSDHCMIEHVRRDDLDDKVARDAKAFLEEEGFEVMLTSSWVEINGVDHDVWHFGISWGAYDRR